MYDDKSDNFYDVIYISTIFETKYYHSYIPFHNLFYLEVHEIEPFKKNFNKKL